MVEDNEGSGNSEDLPEVVTLELPNGRIVRLVVYPTGVTSVHVLESGEEWAYCSIPFHMNVNDIVFTETGEK